MVWPPDPIAADKAPGAPIDEFEHPNHHNALAAAINDTVAQLSFFNESLISSWRPYSPTIEQPSTGTTAGFDVACWSPELSLFVACGYDDDLFTGYYSWVSTDGVSWSVGNLFSNRRRAMAWSPELGIFVAAGAGVVGVSTDGLVWVDTATADSPDHFILWVADLGLFVGTDWGARIVTSPDGVTWTDRAAASALPDREWTGLAWSPDLNLLVCTGYDYNQLDGSNIATSPDGITWTLRTVPIAESSWQRVAWCPPAQKFYTVAYGMYDATWLTGETLLSSSDGITWTPQRFDAALFNIEAENIEWIPELEMLVISDSYAGGPYRVLVSHDGDVWTEYLSATNVRDPIYAPTLGYAISYRPMMISKKDAAVPLTSDLTGVKLLNADGYYPRVQPAPGIFSVGGGNWDGYLYDEHNAATIAGNTLFYHYWSQHPGIANVVASRSVLLNGTGAVTWANPTGSPVIWLGDEPTFVAPTMYRFVTFDAGVTVYGWTDAAPPAAIPPSIVDAKGDLLVASADDTVERIPVSGNDGYALLEDSTQPTGVRWGEVAAAGGSTVAISGSAANFASLPTGVAADLIYVTLDTGDAYLSDGADGWTLLGPIQGPTGATGTTIVGKAGRSADLCLGNTTAETVWSATIPANTIGANVVRAIFRGASLNTSGANRIMVVAIKVGGVTVWQDNTPGMSSNTSEAGIDFDFEIGGDGAAVWLNGSLMFGGVGGSAAGSGDLGSDEIFGNALISNKDTVAVDTTVDVDIEITMHWTITGTPQRVRRDTAYVTVMAS